MAKKPLQFKNMPQEAFTTELVELLKNMDQIKAQINQEVLNILDGLQPGIAETNRCVHSYKLDFATGKRELKIALIAKPTAKAEAPKDSLGDWLKAQQASGRGC